MSSPPPHSPDKEEILRKKREQKDLAKLDRIKQVSVQIIRHVGGGKMKKCEEESQPEVAEEKTADQEMPNTSLPQKMELPKDLDESTLLGAGELSEIKNIEEVLMSDGERRLDNGDVAEEESLDDLPEISQQTVDEIVSMLPSDDPPIPRRTETEESVSRQVEETSEDRALNQVTVPDESPPVELRPPMTVETPSTDLTPS